MRLPAGQFHQLGDRRALGAAKSTAKAIGRCACRELLTARLAASQARGTARKFADGNHCSMRPQANRRTGLAENWPPKRARQRLFGALRDAEMGYGAGQASETPAQSPKRTENRGFAETNWRRERNWDPTFSVRRETGGWKRMEESYVEGVASHDGPESCGVTRKGGGEALTGETAGWVLSREMLNVQGADAVEKSGRQHGAHRHGEVHAGPARSETPCTRGHHPHGSREIPGPPGMATPGRSGKATAVIR
jgi:hypothetical protein